MKATAIRKLKACATMVAAILLPFPMGLQRTAVAALAASSCPIPLEMATQWTYEGRVEWTPSGSGKVKSAQVRWVSEVVDLVESSSGRAAVVRGFPDELAWYEPGQSPGFCVLLSASNRVYRLRADGQNQARALAQRLLQNPRAVPEGAEELFDLPLAAGRKWGQDPLREDTWYGWCVEQVQSKALSVQGIGTRRPLTIYRLAYRTCPDHQLLDVAPGLGVVRFVYGHHGTVASADVHLVSFRAPRAPSAQRRPSP
jgi:hypothetical protein